MDDYAIEDLEAFIEEHVAGLSQAISAPNPHGKDEGESE
jgi:hypothetical protein